MKYKQSIFEPTFATFFSKGLVLFIVGASLTACSHENKLKTEPREMVGEFLAQAAIAAENKLNPGEASGFNYSECVLETKKDKSYCKKVYLEMTRYAKEHSKSFRKVTIEDLSNKETFYRVKDYYIKNLMFRVS